MNEKFTDADEFITQIEKDIQNQSWLENVSDFFVYTLWNRWIKETYWNIKWYFKNLILFQHILWTWRPWDGRYQEELFAFGLEQVKKSIENGNEERTSANKKIMAIEETIAQIRRDVDDEITFDKGNETLEEYGKRYHATMEKRFDIIARLIKGQNIYEYRNNHKSQMEEYEAYVDWFDGTGIDGWWV